MIPSQETRGSGRENGNRFSIGSVSARPIGVNAAMTSPQAAAAASQAAHCELPRTAKRHALAPIKMRALVGAAYVAGHCSIETCRHQVRCRAHISRLTRAGSRAPPGNRQQVSEKWPEIRSCKRAITVQPYSGSWGPLFSG